MAEERPRALEPLDFTDPEALPPLSPSTARDLADVLAGSPECGAANAAAEPQEMKREPEREPAVSSPSPEAVSTPISILATRRHQVMSMNLDEMKEEARRSDVLAETTEAKRARRSAIEKKSRQRRQGALRRMRREVKQLEDVYAAILKQRGTAAEDAIGTANDMYTAPDVQVWKRKYSELTLVAHALEEDQDKLQKLLQQHEVFQQSVRALREQRDEINPRTVVESNADGELETTAVYDTGVPFSSSQDVAFRQRSIPECYAFLRDSYDAFQRFNAGGEFASTGACFMGWTDKRKYDPETDAIQYGFTKTFPMEKDAELLLTRTWDTMLDPASYGRVFLDSTTGQRFQVLQMLSDDLCIVRRDHKRLRTPKTFVTVNMAFRIETPEGFLIVIRSLPAPEIKNAMQEHEFFFEFFTWTHFNQLRDEYGSPTGTKIVTGGSIKNAKMLMSHAWLFEIMTGTLRWESHCIAPIFLKNM